MKLLATSRRLCAACSTLAIWGVVAGCGVGVVTGPGSAPVAAVANGPQLGYLWDSGNQALRPVLGVPGSAQIGQAITPAGMYINGAGSPRSGVALLESANGSLSAMSLPSGAVQAVSGPNFSKLSGSAQIAFSPSGMDAIVYAPGAASLLLVTGLTGIPQSQMLAAPAGLLGAAVSDTAQVAAVYSGGTGAGPLTVALLSGSRSTLGALAGFGGVGFLPSGDDLLLADGATGVITLIRHSSTAPAAQTFTSTTIQTPVAIAASLDGRWAVVANSGDPSVVRLDLGGTTSPLRIACTCQPRQLTPFMGNAVFSLLPLTATPNWAVDASTVVPRTVFIPAVTP
jgi:hypothetical protein